MKNIYLLPTGESRLSLNRSYRDFNVGTEAGEPYWIYSDYKHFHSVTDSSVRPHHMYITNDEEIKEGDWFIYKNEIIHRDKGKIDSMWVDAVKNGKKIILTTDQDLIKDGVQAIDDEFLEWFVKNPSCDKVVVTPYLKDIINSLTNEKYPVIQHRHFDETKMICTYDYELIIPKEEPKQDFILVKENIKLIGEEPTITITLNKEEARGLLNCIIRTSAKGKDLDIGEMVEDKLVEFLNS
jgi:hypothetical protein